MSCGCSAEGGSLQDDRCSHTASHFLPSHLRKEHISPKTYHDGFFYTEHLLQKPYIIIIIRSLVFLFFSVFLKQFLCLHLSCLTSI